jgi:hypothetical protein
MSGYYDSYRGVVIDTADPTGERRVLVEVPDIAVDATGWARPEHAADTVPEVGDEVTIRFESGDESYPIWSVGPASSRDASSHGHYPGTYAGVVIDNVDPGGYGRLLVEAPDVGPDTMWATPVQPGTAAPAIGDGVWVRFDGGDPQRPQWSA